MKIHKKIIVISILTTMLVTFYLPNISKVEGTGTDTGLSSTGEQNENIGTQYEIKEEETWDISKDGDRSVIAKWNLNTRTVSISGNGIMKNWSSDSFSDWHRNKYYNFVEKIIIDKDVSNIGIGLTKKCKLLKSIFVNVENSHFSSIDGVLFNKERTELILYPQNKGTEYIIPDGVQTIRNKAFEESSITSLEIPGSLNTIDGFNNLTVENGGAYSPEPIVNIEMDLERLYFTSEFSSLERIQVNKDNETFSSIDGVLFNKDKTCLIRYPISKKGKKYIIPNTVTKIEGYAFYSVKELEEIEIPDSVTSIGEFGFAHCEKLHNARISENLRTLERYTFYGHSDFEDLIIPQSVTTIKKGNFNTDDFYLTGVRHSDYSRITILNDNIEIEDEALMQSGIIKCNTNSNAHKYAQKNGRIYILLDDDNYPLETESWDISKDNDNSVIATWTASNKTLTISGNGKMKDFQPIPIATGFNKIYERDIENIVIEEGVENLGDNALLRCDNLKRISISSTVSHIGEISFLVCSKLEEINVNEKNQNYSSSAGVLFNKDKTVLIRYPRSKTGEYTIPNTVTKILDEAFSSSNGLERVTIPNSVKEIGVRAFSKCTALESITIPNTVEKLENYAFEYCINLNEVHILCDLETIKESYFYYCNNINKIVIGSGIENIEKNFILSCFNLKQIQVDKNNLKFASKDGVLYSKDMKTIIAYPRGKESLNFEFPEGTTSIGSRAFAGNKKLEYIYIPDFIDSIGEEAFSSLTAPILCKKDSYVHRFAENNKEGYILDKNELNEKIQNKIGDLNKSKEIDTGDVLGILRYIAKFRSENVSQKHPEWGLDSEMQEISDVNKDGKINTADTLILLRYISAKSNKKIAENHPDWLNFE